MKLGVTAPMVDTGGDPATVRLFAGGGFLSGCTARIGFSTQVLILPQRQTVLVARQAACLDLLSGGRFRLGIGIGWNEASWREEVEFWKSAGATRATLNTAFDRNPHRRIASRSLPAHIAALERYP